jgi:hypothetical protein
MTIFTRSYLLLTLSNSDKRKVETKMLLSVESKKLSKTGFG